MPASYAAREIGGSDSGCSRAAARRDLDCDKVPAAAFNCTECTGDGGDIGMRDEEYYNNINILNGERRRADAVE